MLLIDYIMLGVGWVIIGAGVTALIKRLNKLDALLPATIVCIIAWPIASFLFYLIWVYEELTKKAEDYD